MARVAVFDSGLGSLSIIKEIQKISKTEIIYFGDQENFPYGEKSKKKLEKIIKKEGHRATSAQNGKEALELIRTNDYDLIFLDLALPDISGVEILRELKLNNSDQQVVIITGFPESELMDQALNLSPLSVIKKPFKKEQIQGLMKRIFSSSSFQT